MLRDLRAILAVISLLFGFSYYVCWRWLELPILDISAGSFPSFIFVFAFGLLQPTLPTKRQVPYQAHWLLLTLVTEPLFGTTALLDVLAAILGYASVQLLLKYLAARNTHTKTPHPLSYLFAPLLLVGCYLPDIDIAKPVYMSYEELRSAVSAETPRSMTNMGSLIVYQDYLFINELNKGLHVINNIDPTTPQSVGFINIPGNTNVSIRDGILYADSFIDLVVIDLADPENVVEINRQIEVFPYNQYQAVGVDKWFDADEEKGVVIGLDGGSN